MKKFFAVFALVLPLLAVAQTGSITYRANKVTTTAEVLKPGGVSDTGALRTVTKSVIVHDSGSVAAGAAIDSGVLDIQGGALVTVYVVKADSTSRTPTLTLYLSDGVTMVYNLNSSACASGYCQYNYGISASGGTQSLAMALPPKMKFQLAAGSTVAGRVVVVMR